MAMGRHGRPQVLGCCPASVMARGTFWAQQPIGASSGRWMGGGMDVGSMSVEMCMGGCAMGCLSLTRRTQGAWVWKFC